MSDVELSEELVTIARQIAVDNHKGQVRWDGTDYFLHCESVAFSFKEDQYAEMIVAYLHDIIEDTDITEEYLLDYFPSYIVNAIVLLTRVDHDGFDYNDYIDDIKYNKLARRVKMADLRDNIHDLIDTNAIHLPPYLLNNPEKRSNKIKKYFKSLFILDAAEKNNLTI
jgi:(p)ppGpp synthase/HD superfamily hydrolase